MSGTRPVVDMILHQGGKKHRIKMLLNTGCLIALINEQTIKRLDLEQRKHQQERSIEDYMGETLSGAGQYYTEPPLLQRRRDYTRASIKITPMDAGIDVFLAY